MTWEVRIKGPPSDLRMLAEAFTGSERNIVERGAEYFLGGTYFDAFTDPATVRDKARELISSISGASRLFLRSRAALEPDRVERVDAKGHRHIAVFLEDALVVTDAPPVSIVITHADGTVERRLPADPIVAASSRASESEAVRRVLRLRDRDELVWGDLTVIAEVIQADKFKLSERDEGILDRLTGCANSPDVVGDLARHGYRNKKPLPERKRMTLEDARAFIDRIICQWLASKQPPATD